MKKNGQKLKNIISGTYQPLTGGLNRRKIIL
jgi:hypothetical protein